MKPSTPKTEPPPSTQLRKAVSGGALRVKPLARGYAMMNRNRATLFLACLLIIFTLATSSDAAKPESNLIKHAGFEDDTAQPWPTDGERTTAGIVSTSPRAGKRCLHVFDGGDSTGQARSPLFPVQPGVYYVEAWVRADPDHAGTVHFHVQFFDEAGQCLSSNQIGETQQTHWTLLAGFVTVPSDSSSVRLQLQPGGLEGKLRGACFADDFYFAPVDRAKTEGRIRLKHEVLPCSNSDPGGKVGEPPPDIRGKPIVPKSQIDFEDLSGWRMEVFGNLTGSFCRSREQQLAGNYVGKFTFSTEGDTAWVAIHPPKPIRLDTPFQAVQIWCHGQLRRRDSPGPTPRMTVVLRQRKGLSYISLRPFYWAYWSISHWRLSEPTEPGAEIVELRLECLCSDKGKTRTFCFDELSFHNEPASSVDLQTPTVPCPTRPETILPTLDRRFENHVEADGAAFRLTYRGEDGTIQYTYEPRSGGLNDLTVKTANGLHFAPASGGGPVLRLGRQDFLPGDSRVSAELVRAQIEKDAVSAVWRYRAGADAAEVSWNLRLRGKTIILTVDELTGKVARWLFGKPKGLPVEEIAVPYLTNHCEAGPVCLVGNQAFVFSQPDWYVTHSSKFGPQGCEYIPLLDGRRNPLHERIFLTVSTDFHEVLPNIPNPKSPFAHVLGEYVYVNMSGSLKGDALDRCLALWREMKRLGMEKIIVKHHAGTWSSHGGMGNEPFVQRLKAAGNIPGGDEALAKYIRQVKSLGFQLFLYTDYCIFGPVNPHFDEGLVSLNPRGQWLSDWYQYYCLTPLMAPVLAARFAPELKKKYGLTGSYCDEHTAAPPSRYVDFDPRKPGAGMQQTVFRAYCRVFELEKEAYQGPVVSEGGNSWFYAGMVDGNYAQLMLKRLARWQTPFLVDFDLLKIHPLEVDLGMGWRGSYGYDACAKNWDDALDRFLCATIAFGHSGILRAHYSNSNFPLVTDIKTADPLGKWKRSAARTYFMIQQLAARCALVPVHSIRYWDGARLLTTSDAVRSGAYRRSQVAIEYTNGLRIFANGSFEHAWRVNIGERAYDLPPNGWLALQGDEFLEYSALLAGRRVDYVRSPAYTFADGRGHLADFDGLQAKEAVIILHPRGNERHEIAVPIGP